MKVPDPTHWTLNSHFGVFHTIWVHLGLFGCHRTLSAKWVNWCKSSCHEVALEFFETNAPDTPHLTQNSYICEFHTILLQLGLFGWLAKHDGKWAELVRKFVPRSRIGTFRNERTRSTPLDPKLTFWCVFYYSGAFGTLWLPYNT